MKYAEILAERQANAEMNDYEIQRNKPIPGRIHSFVQSHLSFMLMTKYEAVFMFPNELDLETEPFSTPDICIYPKKKLNIKNVKVRENVPPLTTIEILSPSQSLNELMHKAWDLYFPMGVKSAWIVVPEFKAIHIMLPGDVNLYFDKGILKDPATGIEMEVEKVFEDLI